MVDFDNEATVSVPATDVEKITILERRFNLLEALEAYFKNRFSGAQAPLSIIRARLVSLFMQVEAMLKRQMENKKFEELKNACFGGKIKEEELISHITTINKMLDDLRITRIDNRKVYNQFNVEEENKEKGFS